MNRQATWHLKGYFLFLLIISGCNMPHETPTSGKADVDGDVFFPAVVSTDEFSENALSFTKDENVLFLSRTTGWEHQSGHLSIRKDGLYQSPSPIQALDSIYNGAINPSGNQIIFCVKENGKENIYLLKKENDEWSQAVNLSAESGVQGGYFHWWSDADLYFYISQDNGNIVQGKLLGDSLFLIDSLDKLNTKLGTEFSPFVDADKQFIIFSRYLEGEPSQQGFFISFNLAQPDSTAWSIPQKIPSIPYGWNPYIHKGRKEFLYSNGDDIMRIPMEALGKELEQLRRSASP
ncbi:MAG: hypothetical protein AAFV95_27255 [Bacteroidota bacterium]